MKFGATRVGSFEARNRDADTRLEFFSVSKPSVERSADLLFKLHGRDRPIYHSLSLSFFFPLFLSPFRKRHGRA